MRFKTVNSNVTFYVSGRIDGNNAAEIEKELHTVMDGIAPASEKVIIDMEDLDYISSAGLRVLLKLRKRADIINKNVEVVNVNDAVYDIMEMTGFNEILSVQRALRKISVDEKNHIRSGVNSDIYHLDNETVVKVFNKNRGLEFIQDIKANARELFALGIPTTMSFDTVKVGDRYGIVYEKMNTPTLAKMAEKDPAKCEEYGRMMGRLLKTLHETEDINNEFENYTDKVTEWIDILEERCGDFITPEIAEKMRSVQRAFSRKNVIIHGDFHEGNVMLQDGELMLIDIDDISCGNPAFDLISNFLNHDFIAENAPNAAKISMGVSAEILPALRRYMLMEYTKGNVSDLRTLESSVRVLAPFRLLLTPAIAWKGGNRNISEKTTSAMFNKFVPIFKNTADDMIAAAAFFNLTY